MARNKSRNELFKNISNNMDAMYNAINYNSHTSRRKMDSKIDSISDHLDKISKYNMDSNGNPNISKFYTRIKDKQDKLGNKTDISSIFDNVSGIEDFYSGFMSNHYLIEMDEEIDAVCRYFPELLEALDVKKEGVLSADHFSKDFLTIKRSSDTDADIFEDRIDRLKVKYDLLTLVDDIYDVTAKYGEQFVYIVPYSTAIAKLLKNKNNTNNIDSGRYTISNESESNIPRESSDNKIYDIDIKNNKFTISDSNTSECVLSESTTIPSDDKNNKDGTVHMSNVLKDNTKFKMKLNICKSGIIESVILNQYKYNKMYESMNESSMESNFKRNTILEKGSELAIVSKDKETGDLKMTTKEDILKQRKGEDGFTDIDNKKDDDKPLNINGCVISKVKRYQVFPLYVNDTDKVLGYYYVELRTIDSIEEYQDTSYVMGDTLTSMRGANNGDNAPFNAVDQSDQENLLRYLSYELSRFIDREFVQSNQDLSEEIYILLKQNDLFNGSNIDEVKVSFIPPEDMVHVYFKLDPKTHRGISDLEKSMVPAKIYACMYITEAIAQMVRGQDKRVFYVKQNVDTNISQTLLNTIQQIKQGNFGLRQFTNINNVLNMTGRFNDFIIPTNSGGDSPVNIEVLPGQQFSDNTEKMNQLKEMAVTSTDVPFEFIQTRQSVDYAMQLSMSSSRFLRKIYHRQGLYTKFLNRIITKIYNYEYNENEDLNVILPPPMFLNMANTNQMVDNIKQFTQSITEYKLSTIDDDKLKNTYMEKIFEYYIGTHVEISELDKLFKQAQIEIQTNQDKSDDGDNGGGEY